jgi:MFS family permease
MLSGNAVFLIASIACGMATSGPMLLASRAVQGVGAAFMVTGAIALVAGAFPNQSQRTRAFGIIGVISGVAMALGPSLGGLLVGRLPLDILRQYSLLRCAGFRSAATRC